MHILVKNHDDVSEKKNQVNERKKQLHMSHILKQKFKLDEEAK